MSNIIKVLKIGELDARDKSTKPFEVIQKMYTFKDPSRNLERESCWFHMRYYNTLEAAETACKSFRQVRRRRVWVKLLSLIDRNAAYERTIELFRYKVIQRDTIINE